VTKTGDLGRRDHADPEAGGDPLAEVVRAGEQLADRAADAAAARLAADLAVARARLVLDKGGADHARDPVLGQHPAELVGGGAGGDQVPGVVALGQAAAGALAATTEPTKPATKVVLSTE